MNRNDRHHKSPGEPIEGAIIMCPLSGNACWHNLSEPGQRCPLYQPWMGHHWKCTLADIPVQLQEIARALKGIQDSLSDIARHVS